MTGCCSVDEFIESLGCQLKDPDHIRWTKEYLLWVFCLAAHQIALDRADLFKEEKKIKLEPGCYTEVCKQGCQEVGPPFYLPGDDCAELEVIDSNDDWIGQYFPTLKCMDDIDPGEYRPERIEIDIENPCRIKVEPEVPDAGKAYYIMAQCQKDPAEDVNLGGSFPAAICRYINAFTQLVLHYTYSMDSMVNLDPSQANDYFERYVTLMAIDYAKALSNRDAAYAFGQLISPGNKKIGLS